ncbi:MAG TPA: EscU/YscU/HrcU family type III secretion system export apparatus switch protein [Bryobacteraceae bacterium]|jgi:flagellar biosynthetic protein FlhB
MPDQKTEQPTAHRLRKARQEGQFASSRDLIVSVQLIIALAVGVSMGSHLVSSIGRAAEALFRRAFLDRDVNAAEVPALFGAGLAPSLEALFAMGGLVTVLVLVVQLATTGFGFSFKPLMPDLGRLNPSPRLKRMAWQNLSSAAKALVLIPIIGVVLYAAIFPQLPELANLAMVGLGSGLKKASGMIGTLLWRLSLALLVIGVIDFARQRRRFTKDLRMTKQEIKDEMKEMDGNPQMKMRIRRLQRDIARRSMMKAVPKASVVIVNPTHYAIALHYEMNSKSVPTVVAKGKNYLAQLIREKAREHEVPIMENKPLAQALYQAVEVGQEIPPHLYRAVAEVLAHIYKSLNRR